jgi:hypothetical protein
MGSDEMPQDLSKLLGGGIGLPGQPGMAPEDLHRRLRQIIEGAPMPFDDGNDPLASNEMEWVGQASALISMLRDLTLIGETQVAIQRADLTEAISEFPKTNVDTS